jgi:hypothetical protein
MVNLLDERGKRLSIELARLPSNQLVFLIVKGFFVLIKYPTVLKLCSDRGRRSRLSARLGVAWYCGDGAQRSAEGQGGNQIFQAIFT